MSDSVSITQSGLDPFDFDKWIIQNEFIEIKDLFIKNNMTSTHCLNMQSPNLCTLIQDICSTDTVPLQNVLCAIQALDKQHTSTKCVN